MATDPTIIQSQMLAELKAMHKTMESEGSMGGGSALKSRGAVSDEEAAIAKRSQKLADQMSKKMQKSANKQIRAQGRLIKNIDDVYRAQERYNKFNIKTFIKIKEQKEKNLITEQQAEEQLREIGARLSDLEKPLVIVSDRYNEQIEILGDVNEKLEQAGRRSEGLGKAFNAVKVLAMAAGKQLYDVTTASMRSGVDMTQQGILQARMMGMSQVELIETQGQYRNAIEASGMSSDAFSDMMEKSAWELGEFTGSLKEGALFAAESTRTFRNLGAVGITQTEFLKEQQNIYKDLHSTLSMTTDQFKEMNSQLLNGQTTREQMFKMDIKRRGLYFLELQSVTKQLFIDGLTQEAAMRAVEAMQAMGAAAPKTRLKEAAKMQALAGALGMGAEGEEMARLQRGGLRGKGDKARFAELSAMLTKRISSEMSSGDFGREMVVSQLLESTGMMDRFGPGGAMAELALAEGRKIGDVVSGPTGAMTTQNSVDLTESQVKLTLATQALAAAMTEGPMSALTSVLTGAGFLSAMKMLGGGGASVAAKTVGGAKALTGLASGGAALATTGAALTAAGAVGYAIGTGIEKTLMNLIPDQMSKAGDWFFGGIGNMVDGLQNLVGIEDTAEEKQIAEGRRLLEETNGKKTDELIELQKESNFLAGRRYRSAEEQADRQTSAVDNQTRSENVNRRKYFRGAPRS